jgi:hypothetical protein
LRAVITPRIERVTQAASAAFLGGWDDLTVTGTVHRDHFALRATTGFRTPWRQRLEGGLSPNGDGSLLGARSLPSRWAAVYFAGGAWVFIVVAISLASAGLVALLVDPHPAEQLLESAFVALFFGFWGALLGRLSCRLGLAQADRLLALLDEAAGCPGLVVPDNE